MIRRLLPNILLSIISILITYSVLEAAYRIYKYMRLRQGYRYYFQSVDAPLYRFDPDIGYRHRPNVTLHHRQFDPDNHLLISNVIRVNNLGHIAPRDDMIYKPRSEFRIAILGDSFTACITNDVPWPVLLEDILNTDDTLKRMLNVSTFKVINLGMSGTGIVQWARVYEHEVERFDPDLVIVNFVTDDIQRKFLYRTTVNLHTPTTDYSLTLTCTSLPLTLDNKDCALVRIIVIDPRIVNDKKELVRIKREIHEERVKRIPWFALYPELLARAVGYRFGLRARLHPGSDFTLYYENQDEAMNASLEALRAITSKHPKVLILHNPTYDELRSRKTPSSVLELMKKDRHLKIQLMTQFLPVQTDDAHIKRWFNLPYDAHFSNYGAGVYARAVYKKIRYENGMSQ